MSMEKKFKIQIPSLPTYFRIEGGSDAIGVWELTEAEIREIGAEWTEALVVKGRTKI